MIIRFLLEQTKLGKEAKHFQNLPCASLMSSKPSSSTKEKLIDDEEEVLQAVILADSFNKRFRPLTTQKPRVGKAFDLQTPTPLMIAVSTSGL